MAMVSDARVANLARVIINCKLGGRDGDGARRLSSQYARVILNCKLGGRDGDGTRRLSRQSCASSNTFLNCKKHALRDGFHMPRKNVVNALLQLSHKIWF